jgi:hypothetical protein
MKFDQFSDSEGVMSEVKHCLDYIATESTQDSVTATFVIIPKLNFIFRSDMSVRLFLDITREYRSNRNITTKILACGYVYLIALCISLGLAGFALRRAELTAPVFYPAILGGNNRLRFIDSSNSQAIVVAKNRHSQIFTRNAIRAYEASAVAQLDLVPAILKISDGMYLEKQIKGKAINRGVFGARENAQIFAALDLLFQQQRQSARSVTFDALLRYKLTILKRLSAERSLANAEELNSAFVEIGAKLTELYADERISVTLSHGDLNKGNIFLASDGVSIIDWEYYMYRCEGYDEVIYRYDFRHKSFEEYRAVFAVSPRVEFDTLLFLFEELFFRILNYKADVADSQRFVTSTNNLILNEISRR